MHTWIGFIVAAMVAPSIALAQTAPSCGSPADLGDGWPVASPEQQQLQGAPICALGPRFEAWKQANTHAILVVRHGVLVYEHYFAGEDERWGEPLGKVAYDAGTKHDL